MAWVKAIGAIAMIRFVWKIPKLFITIVPGIDARFNKLCWAATVLLACAALAQFLVGARHLKKEFP